MDPNPTYAVSQKTGVHNNREKEDPGWKKLLAQSLPDVDHVVRRYTKKSLNHVR
jgi:hypothetical protein